MLNERARQHHARLAVGAGRVGGNRLHGGQGATSSVSPLRIKGTIHRSGGAGRVQCHEARRLARLGERDVLVLVLLFVEDDDVQESDVLGSGGVGPSDGRRAHVVELAHLRGALQHLHGVRVVRDVKLPAREERSHRA